jgi:hypothetical protein
MLQICAILHLGTSQHRRQRLWLTQSHAVSTQINCSFGQFATMCHLGADSTHTICWRNYIPKLLLVTGKIPQAGTPDWSSHRPWVYVLVSQTVGPGDQWLSQYNVTISRLCETMEAYNPTTHPIWSTCLYNYHNKLLITMDISVMFV